MRKPFSLPGTSNRHLRETVNLSIPVMIGQLGIVLTGVMDNMMVGWLSYEHLSAASLANSLFFIIVVISMGITNAVSPLVAEADAADNKLLCATYLRQGLWVGVGSSVITMALLEASVWVLPYLDQPPQDVLLAGSYLRWLYVSVPPMVLFLTYKQYTDGLSRTRVAMMVTIAGLLINGLVNWLLIFGNLGFPRMELDGAGIGTFVSRMAMLLLIGWYVHKGQKIGGPGLPLGSWKPDWPAMKKILSIGLPSGLQLFFEVGAFCGAVIMIGWMGAAPRSAHQIVLNMSSVTYMVVTGIAAGCTIRVGNARGRLDMLNARQAGFAGFWLGGIFMFFSALVFFFGRDFLPTLYNNHPDVLRITPHLMIMAGLFQIFDGLQAVGLGVLRGLQDVVKPMIIAFVCYWLVALPLGYVSGFVWELGVAGVWIGFVVSLGMAAAAFMYRFRKLTKA
ncbi:MAG: MATE family efflux transporter [Bacteroidia bacterium]|nr:MATE family efflux transporter [Bacteroidia bacterium]